MYNNEKKVIKVNYQVNNGICEICGKLIMSNMYIGELTETGEKRMHTKCYSNKYGLLTYPNKRRDNYE